MDSIASFGQAFCFLIVQWVGTAGQCYHGTHAQSMGFAAVAAFILATGCVGLVIARRLRT